MNNATRWLSLLIPALLLGCSEPTSPTHFRYLELVAGPQYVLDACPSLHGRFGGALVLEGGPDATRGGVQMWANAACSDGSLAYSHTSGGAWKRIGTDTYEILLETPDKEAFGAVRLILHPSDRSATSGMYNWRSGRGEWVWVNRWDRL